MYSPYEWDIVQLIIDYSIRHDIIIPVINYKLYARRKALQEKQQREEEEASLRERPKPFRRRKIDQPGDESEPEYDYFEDFMEAIREEHMVNPRFRLHPDIQEFVDCSFYGEKP